MQATQYSVILEAGFQYCFFSFNIFRKQSEWMSIIEKIAAEIFPSQKLIFIKFQQQSVRCTEFHTLSTFSVKNLSVTPPHWHTNLSDLYMWASCHDALEKVRLAGRTAEVIILYERQSKCSLDQSLQRVGGMFINNLTKSVKL